MGLQQTSNRADDGADNGEDNGEDIDPTGKHVSTTIAHEKSFVHTFFFASELSLLDNPGTRAHAERGRVCPALLRRGAQERPAPFPRGAWERDRENEIERTSA